MSQIRDVGDGIRGGTYTMTAPVITGGSITGVALSGNTLTNPVITGGSINNTPIGATTANTGAFTTLGATGVATFSAGTVSAPAITTTGDTNTGIFFPAADTIAFTEGGVESMRINASGQVGVGTSTFATNSKFAVQTSTCKLDIVSEGGSSVKLLAGSGGITLSAPSGLFFENGGTQQFEARDLQLYSAGTIKATTTISVGNATPSTSGAGITFPATQSASSDANTLDDYEEGTWTPSLVANSGTLTTVVNGTGNYTKVGNVVTITCKPSITTNGTGSGALRISGLPFAASPATRLAGASREDGVTGNTFGFSAFNSNEILLQKYDGTYLGGNGYSYPICLTYLI